MTTRGANAPQTAPAPAARADSFSRKSSAGSSSQGDVRRGPDGGKLDEMMGNKTPNRSPTSGRLVPELDLTFTQVCFSLIGFCSLNNPCGHRGAHTGSIRTWNGSTTKRWRQHRALSRASYPLSGPADAQRRRRKPFASSRWKSSSTGGKGIMSRASLETCSSPGAGCTWRV